MIDEALKTEVAEGANWCDNNIPDWHNRILIDSLRMGLCSRCILGQLVGDYFEALSTYHLTLDEARSMGFDLQNYNETTYSELRELWVLEIEKRRALK